MEAKLKRIPKALRVHEYQPNCGWCIEHKMWVGRGPRAIEDESERERKMFFLRSCGYHFGCDAMQSF
jgi:hypothetical protein